MARYEISDELREYRQELQKEINKANKRLTRLEENEMTSLPAYKQFQQSGGREGERFSIAGITDPNALRVEEARVKQFLNAQTSLVREANKYLKTIADQRGIEYDSVKELPRKTKNYFELASKIEQLERVDGSFTARGSEERFTDINKFIKDNDIDLSNVNPDDVLPELYNYVDEARTSRLEQYNEMEDDWFGFDGN